jgi:hypothetical protein
MSTGQPIDEQISLEHEPELNKFFKAAIKSESRSAAEVAYFRRVKKDYRRSNDSKKD